MKLLLTRQEAKQQHTGGFPLSLQGALPTPEQIAEQKQLAEARDKLVKALVGEVSASTCHHSAVPYPARH